MARKITLNGQFHKPIEEVFDDFVVSQTAQGLSEITLATYHHHLRSISNHLDIQKPLEALTRKDLEGMVVSMRVAGLAHNSISSYCRVFRTFLNWCKRGGMNVPELPNIKDKETVKGAFGAVQPNITILKKSCATSEDIYILATVTLHQPGKKHLLICRLIYISVIGFI